MWSSISISNLLLCNMLNRGVFFFYSDIIKHVHFLSAGKVSSFKKRDIIAFIFFVSQFFTFRIPSKASNISIYSPPKGLSSCDGCLRCCRRRRHLLWQRSLYDEAVMQSEEK